MGELHMDCLGSVILFNKETAYCAACPLQNACELQVAENRTHLEEALKRPVFDDAGKFWKKGVDHSQRKRAYAAQQSVATPPKEIVSVKPPATTAAVVKPVDPPASKIAPSTAPPGQPKKVVEQLEKWSRLGVDPSLIEKGENPFAAVVSSFGFANDYVNAWLQMPSKPSRKVLEAAIIASRPERPLTPGTMNSQFNIVTGAFRACGYELLAE